MRGHRTASDVARQRGAGVASTSTNDAEPARRARVCSERGGAVHPVTLGAPTADKEHPLPLLSDSANSRG